MRIELEVEAGDQASLAAFLRALGDEANGFPELALVAERDPGLAAAILKLANSSYYGLAGEVDRLDFACAVVGVLGLRSLTVAELARRRGPYPSELARFANQLTVEMQRRAAGFAIDEQVALSVGLVATLGWVLAVQQDPVGYAQLMELPIEERRGYEIERWEEPLVRLTQRALAHWAFPEAIVAAVGELDGQGEPSPLGALLRTAWQATLSSIGPDAGLSAIGS